MTFHGERTKNMAAGVQGVVVSIAVIVGGG
jgi:hypothetical protein